MGFVRILPQVAAHPDGYRVEVFDRYHVEYIDDEQRVMVEVDLEGPGVRVLCDSAMSSRSQTLEGSARQIVLTRIREGIATITGDTLSSVELIEDEPS